MDKKNNSLLYLGRFEMLERWDSNENKGYRYCFVNMKSYQDKNDVIGGLVDYPSINGKLIKVESDIIPNDLGRINAPIGRDPIDRMKMSVVKDGKEAITNFKVLERFKKFTLVELQLETGRTHQIRVHMNYINHLLFSYIHICYLFDNL